MQTMALVVGTLRDLIHNLRPFAGVLVVSLRWNKFLSTNFCIQFPIFNMIQGATNVGQQNIVDIYSIYDFRFYN